MTDSIFAIVELFPGWTTASHLAAAAGRRVKDGARAVAHNSWLGALRSRDAYVSSDWLRQHQVSSSKHADY
jgi:hypothetical protein